VEVRALYDAIGGAGVHGKFMKKLVEAGGQAAPFLPVNLFERRLRVNFRNHRKIIVIDGEVAFTGGINIADEYRDWHDTACRFEGPVVYQFQEVFAEDWFFATREEIVDERYFPEPDTLKQGGDAHARLMSSGPDMKAHAIHKAFFLAMTRASSRLWLITPYFIPDEAILMALETAAMRGIDVRIIIPARDASDVGVTYWAGRAFYERLLEAGVQIHEFSGRILHAKHLLIDEEWSFVGSSNMDIRSFRLNFETNCIVSQRDLNQVLATFFTDTLEHCARVELDDFYTRPRHERLFEATMRLFSPLL
jgi:cardiolipin synthase